MRAFVLVRHGEPEEAFELRDLPDPEPGPGQVRIAVEAFGLNFADVSARRGTYRDAPPLPAVIGYDVVGRVDAVGAGVDRPRIGERVAALTRFGGYATMAVTDARAAVPVPDDMDAGTATALATQGVTAWYMAEDLIRLHPGEHVLVHAAAGGVGSLLVQIAAGHGCVVYATAGGGEKLEVAQRLGATHVIDYRREDFAASVQRLCPDGLDVVFDSLGGASVRRGLTLLAPGGRMVCFGAASHAAGQFQFLRSLRFAASFGFPHPIPLLIHSRSLLGVNMLRIADRRPETIARCLKGITAAVREGRLRPIVGGEYSARRLAEAHADLEQRRTIGKLVVRWDDHDAR